MTTGFKNNNPANINYAGQDWEGWTGKTVTTSDGKKNMVFTNRVYGLRAAMVIIQNYMKNYGIYNIADILRRWSPNQSESERQQRAKYIANTYFGGANTEDDILDLSDKTIEGLTKGIIKGEITESNQIPQVEYDAAIRYLNSGDDTEAASYTSANNSSGGSFGIVAVVLLIGGVGYLLSKK